MAFCVYWYLVSLIQYFIDNNIGIDILDNDGYFVYMHKTKNGGPK